MSDHQWTLADFVLVVVFLVAVFGAGVMVKTMHEVEKMTDESHTPLAVNSEGIPLSGPGR